jgi:hypothetical protein
MKHLNRKFLSVLTVICICLFTINVYAAETKQDAARSDAAPDEWEFVLELYGWLPDIETTTASGDTLELDLETILENLDLIVFTAFGARKNRWQFMTDVIYMDLSDDPDIDLNPLLQVSDLGMKAWVINPYVSYEIFGNRKGSFQILAGARYLDLEVDLELTTRPPLPPGVNSESVSADVWDGIVGVRGFYMLTEQWFVPYRLDIGTGDSDFTWHALAGIGYKFDTFKLIAGYRHMAWEFEDDSVLDDLQVSGLIVGAIFTF